MKLAIVIPTLNRKEKLEKCINSILRSAKTDNIILEIFFGNIKEIEYFKPFFVSTDNIKLHYLDKYNVPQFWNDYLKNMESDMLLYLNDDIEIFDDTLSVILREFERNFPDTDGVLGINQVNIHDIHKVEAAFGVIGKKYADRFPNREVFCPAYNRFWADFELWQYAKSIGKFVFCRQAQLNHYHPSINKEWEDSTHNEVRKYLRQDKLTFQKRQAAGLLWGKTYELLK